MDSDCPYVPISMASVAEEGSDVVTQFVERTTPKLHEALSVHSSFNATNSTFEPDVENR
jgi:hypothetical protein